MKKNIIRRSWLGAFLSIVAGGVLLVSITHAAGTKTYTPAPDRPGVNSDTSCPPANITYDATNKKTTITKAPKGVQAGDANIAGSADVDYKMWEEKWVDKNEPRNSVLLQRWCINGGAQKANGLFNDYFSFRILSGVDGAKAEKVAAGTPACPYDGGINSYKVGAGVLPSKITNTSENPHAKNDRKPNENSRKTIHQKAADGSWTTGQVTQHKEAEAGDFTQNGKHYKFEGKYIVSGVAKQAADLTNADKAAIIADPYEDEVEEVAVLYPAPGRLCDDDADGDFSANGQDNCPGIANPAQDDLDTNGIGDACDSASFADASGTYSLQLNALSIVYGRCLADVQQSGMQLTSQAYCYLDSQSIVVNPEGASGAMTCPPAPAAQCGDGSPGAGAPPPYGDINDVHTVLSGTLAGSTIELAGCFEDRDGASTEGHLYIELSVSVPSGAGSIDRWPMQTLPDCLAGTPQGAAVIWPVRAVRLALKSANHDSDGDGCPDKRELSNTVGQGGLRDPFNEWDYFNPTQDGLNRVDDILAVVDEYFDDDPPGAIDYGSQSDRTTLIGGNPGGWNLGPPNGQQRVDDILNAVKQYFHDC